MKNRIRVEFILDESGSMASQRQTVVNGFNEQIQEMRKEQETKGVEYVLSLTKFNTQTTIVFSKRPLSEVNEITLADFTPNGGTALYDALGVRIDTAEEGEENVMVFIFTDGEENASKNFNDVGIRALVDIRQKQGWAFTFFGADMNAALAGSKIGVFNNVNYSASCTYDAFQAVNEVRSAYTTNVTSGMKGLSRSMNITANVDESKLNSSNMNWQVKQTTTTGK